MPQPLRTLVWLVAAASCAAAPGHASAPSDLLDADVIFLPTPHAVVSAMLRLAGVRAGDRLYDLGAGDGRIVIQAARAYGIKAVGIEVDARKVAEARANVRRAGLEQLVEIRHANALEADLRDATLVTIFLFPELNERLAPKLRAELAPGSRIVSHRFGLGDWAPAQRVDAYGHPLLLWVVPPR